MGGFSSVTGLETIVNADNASFDGTERGGAMTTNGQLWIGSTALPHVKLGNITSPLGTLTIGYSSPNITLDVTGGSVGETITGNIGGPLSPVAGNWNILGIVVPAASTPVQTSGSGNTLTVNVQRSQAISSTDASRIGLASFDSTSFAVDSNGFVTLKGAGFTWNDVSGAFSPLKDNGYFVTGTATGTLPASPAQGDTIKFFVDHASQLLTLQATGTQIIRFGTSASSAAGTAVSTQRGDSVELVYRTSDTCWCAVNFVGGWNFT